MTITELIKALQEIANPNTTVVHYWDEYRSVKVTEIELDPDKTETKEYYEDDPLPKDFIVLS